MTANPYERHIVDDLMRALRSTCMDGAGRGRSRLPDHHPRAAIRGAWRHSWLSF